MMISSVPIHRPFYTRVPFIIMSSQNTSASDSYSQIVSALWNNGSVRLCHRPPSSLRHVSSFSTPSPLDETTIVYPWQQQHQIVPKRVKIVEVGPRDGLQNESTLVSTQDKLSFIHKLIQAHISCIEITSFVSPKWVPSMADASEIVQGIQSWRRPTTSNDDDSTFMVLVPNLQGLQNALNAGGIDQIAVFTSASEAFSQRNINCRYVYIRVLDVG